MDAAASGSREPAPPAPATTPVRAQPGSQYVYVIVEGHMSVWSYPRGGWEWMVARKCPGSCPAGLNPRWREGGACPSLPTFPCLTHILFVCLLLTTSLASSTPYHTQAEIAPGGGGGPEAEAGGGGEGRW